MKEAIDEIVGEIYTPPGNTGLVVGVTNSGRPSVFGYGEKQGAGYGPRSPTIYEPDSLSFFPTSKASANRGPSP